MLDLHAEFPEITETGISNTSVLFSLSLTDHNPVHLSSDTAVRSDIITKKCTYQLMLLQSLATAHPVIDSSTRTQVPTTRTRARSMFFG